VPPRCPPAPPPPSLPCPSAPFSPPPPLVSPLRRPLGPLRGPHRCLWAQRRKLPRSFLLGHGLIALLGHGLEISNSQEILHPISGPFTFLFPEGSCPPPLMLVCPGAHCRRTEGHLAQGALCTLRYQDLLQGREHGHMRREDERGFRGRLTAGTNAHAHNTQAHGTQTQEGYVASNRPVWGPGGAKAGGP